MIASAHADGADKPARRIGATGPQDACAPSSFQRALVVIPPSALNFISSAIPFNRLSRMLNRYFTKLAVLAAIVWLGSFAIAAQTPDTASIRGQVVDSNGAAIPSAQIVITNEQTGFRRETKSNDNGNFAITSLPLTGGYAVAVKAQNFSSQTRNNIELRANETATINIRL